MGTSVCSGDVMDADAYEDANSNDAAVAVVENYVVHKPRAVEIALAADGDFDAAAAVGIAVGGNCWNRLQCWECTVTWAS